MAAPRKKTETAPVPAPFFGMKYPAPVVDKFLHNNVNCPHGEGQVSMPQFFIREGVGE